MTSEATRKSMQGNRSKDTKPELVVRKMLRQMGFPGYRLQWKTPAGRVDIAYPGRKIAILVNGCFWHRCPYCNLPIPKGNTEYWEAKFARNIERDKRMVEGLEDDGWSVFTVWECQLKKDKVEDTCKTIYAFVSLGEVEHEMPEIDVAPLK